MSKRAIWSAAKRRMARAVEDAAAAEGRRRRSTAAPCFRRAAARRSCRWSAGPRARGRRLRACMPRGLGVGDRARRRPRCVPRVGASTPATTSASSRWPLPETPAMPTISPARSVSETSFSAAPPPARRDAVEDEERRAGRDRRLLRRAQIAAAHQARQLALRQAAVVRPLGDDLAVAHDGDAVGDRRSPRRACGEMKMTPMPRAVMARSAANRPSVSRGVSVAVGSSRTRMRAPRTSDLAISTRCCSPIERSPTSRSGSSSMWKSRPIAASRSIDGRGATAAVRSGAADEEVLQDRVARHQLEMLVDHADAERQRIGGVADRRPACRRPRSCPRRRVGAEEDVHQAGLAGAVLAEQAEDVAGVQA